MFGIQQKKKQKLNDRMKDAKTKLFTKKDEQKLLCQAHGIIYKRSKQQKKK